MSTILRRSVQSLKNVSEACKETINSKCMKYTAVGAVVVSTVSAVHADIVAYDTATKAITWDFSSLLEGQMGVITAAIAIAAVIFIGIAGWKIAKRILA